MCACARLLLLAALPALAGVGGWCAGGEVVSLVVGGAERAGGAGGAEGPAFAGGQATAVVAPLGHSATLECRVLRLGDKSVSWVRSRDLQILSHAGVVFTADARVAATRAGTSHALTIRRLRAADAGRYECQVNTEPKLSLLYNLTVVDEVVPRVVVEALGGRTVSGAVGGAATLACSARYSPAPVLLPAPPLDVRWRRAGAGAGAETIHIATEGGRGGVSLDTERWAARVESRLTLAGLAEADAGLYACEAAGQADTLRLLVSHDAESAEAMQRDQAASGGSPRGAGPRPAGMAVLAGTAGTVMAALVTTVLLRP